METGEATDPRRVKSTPPPITRSTPVAVSPGLVFGVPLAAVLQDKNGQPWPSCVPPIVEDTVNYLEARGKVAVSLVEHVMCDQARDVRC